MDSKYGFFLPYHHYYIGDYVTIRNGSKELILGMLQPLWNWGGNTYRSGKYSKYQYSPPPLYYLWKHHRLLVCSYIGKKKVIHMWFPYFALTIDDRLYNLVNYEYLGIMYKYVLREYKQSKLKSVSSTSIPTTKSMLIPQDESSLDTSGKELDTPQD